jgi:hypothetical protein
MLHFRNLSRRGFNGASRKSIEGCAHPGLLCPAGVGGVFFCIQLSLIFLKSKEDVELAEFKRIQSAENEHSATEIENRTKTASAITERMLLEIQSGKIEDAARWRDFLKD